MSQTTIHRIPILPFGMVNAHAIVNEKTCILVDAGLPGTEEKVRAGLRSLGRDLEDISLIVITHAHVDHAGNAAGLQQLSGAQVVAHREDVPYLQGLAPMQFCATGWFGHAFWQTGAITEKYPALTPSVVLESGRELDLAPWGIAGRAVHTGGHTPGSLSVVLDDGSALVGDLVASGILLGGIVRTGRAKQPPFEDDPLQVAAQLQRLTDRGVERFYLGHGGPLPAAEVRRHAEWLTGKQRNAAPRFAKT